MIKTLGWSVMCCVMGLLGCASDDDPKADPPPELDFTAFDEAVEQYLVDNSLEGATAVIVHRDWGVMHESGYGAFDVNRISLVASSSKMVSVGILMRLADQGDIDIDGPIGEYLGAWNAGKPELTVAQLLSNSSGLPGLLDNPIYAPYLCQYNAAGTVSECAQNIYTADDSAQRVPPDTQFRYGGGQWQLAGGIAEVVSGKSWDELFTETYATPCGLENSGYTNQFQIAALNYPADFEGDIADLPVTDNPSVEGGMYTTVQDYAELLLMQLRGGMCGNHRVLSASAVETMQSDRIGDVYDGNTGVDPTFPGYGLGWWVSRDVPGLVQDAGAYGAVPWIDNERGYAALIILESQAATGATLAQQTRPLLETIFDDAQP